MSAISESGHTREVRSSASNRCGASPREVDRNVTHQNEHALRLGLLFWFIVFFRFRPSYVDHSASGLVPDQEIEPLR
jgi:hypothetical protein